MMENHDDTYLSRYEEMVSDFESWIHKLVNFIGMEIPENIIMELKSEANFCVQENKYNHIRQITPGDYCRKLLPETQEAITENLRDVLDYFGYTRA